MPRPTKKVSVVTDYRKGCTSITEPPLMKNCPQAMKKCHCAPKFSNVTVFKTY